MIKLLILVLTLSACTHNKKTHNLKLVKAYEVETYGKLEPSGITLWNGQFYAISDKHDQIYLLEFLTDKIVFTPHISIVNKANAKLDFEGITHDENNFYLISENLFQILKVSKDGSQQTWLPTSNRLKLAGEEVGLFQTPNAYFEGICLLGNGNFLLAAERQPRGFMEYNSGDDSINAYQMDSPVFKYDSKRSPDFTGLSCDDGVYVLDRNAETVALLEKIDGKYQETIGYSYKHIINQENLKYQNRKYGQAEGVVVKGNKFYIIFDNNRNYFLNNPQNNNSLFLEMQIQ